MDLPGEMWGHMTCHRPTDNYAKDGGAEADLHSCHFYHEPLHA